MRNIISKTFISIGIFILSFIFFNIFLISLSWIVKLNIINISIYISFIMSIFMTLIYFYKCSETKKEALIYTAIMSIVSILLVIISFNISSNFFDISWDGNSYHKTTIGSIKNGWNPVYEHVEDFSSKSDNNKILIDGNYGLWTNHYARASHTFAASVYNFTGDIESGKSINILSIIILFSFVFGILIEKKNNFLFSLFTAVAIVSCPVFTAQLFTSYVDILVGIYLFLLIGFFFVYESNTSIDKRMSLLLYVFAMIIIINIKFSSFAFAGIFCLGYYIWYIIRIKRKKINKDYFKAFTIASIIGVLLGVFVVGLSVYPKNYFDHGNPFYPLFGKDKVDIIVPNQPDYFKSKNTLDKFYISMFSKSENISQGTQLEATFKTPFTFDKAEYNNLMAPDLRIGGFGVLFSGIFIITLLFMLHIYPSEVKDNKKLSILIGIPYFTIVILIFTLSESWWARYFPQLFLMAIFPLILVYDYSSRQNKNKKITLKILFYLVMVIILVNNLIVFSSCYNYNKSFTDETNRQFELFKEKHNKKGDKIIATTDYFYGAFYNIQDHFGSNNVLISQKDDKIEYYNINYYISIGENKK